MVSPMCFAFDRAEGNNQELRVEAMRVPGVIGEARSLNRILVALADLE